MKKHITITITMWAIYGFALWFFYGYLGIAKDFMPTLWCATLSSLLLAIALWESFILYGLNELRKDARDAELVEWFNHLGESYSDDLSWSVSIPAPNGYQFEIWWNGAITMWQAELWDMTVMPTAICDRDVFVTKDEAIDWFVKTSKTLDKF